MSMMDPGDHQDPQKKGPSTTRITIWIVVSAVGLYFVISGLWGALHAGS
ncbi:MAG TPA: hypothetical protein VNJ54_07770 [Plantibacter sp.]|nr:hypothetical protein [Plantibacter sp.]